MRRRAASAFVSLILSAGTALGAPGARVDLTWDAPPECPSGETVLADAYDLAREARAESEDRISVAGTVRETSAGRWRLELRIGKSAQRVLEAGSCEELSSAGALFIALLISPSMMPSLAEEPPTSPEPPPAPPPPAPPPPPPPGAPQRKPVSVHVALGPGLDAGLEPAVAPLARGVLGIRQARWQLELQGAFHARQELDVGAPPVATARFSAGAAEVGPCALLLDRARVKLGPCLRMELGVLHARATSASGTTERWSARPAVDLEPATVWVRWSRWLDLRVQTGAAFALANPRFTLDGYGTVHRPYPVTFRAAVLLSAHTR